MFFRSRREHAIVELALCQQLPVSESSERQSRKYVETRSCWADMAFRPAHPGRSPAEPARQKSSPQSRLLDEGRTTNMGTSSVRGLRVALAALLALSVCPSDTLAEPLPREVAQQVGRFPRSHAGFTQRALRRAGPYLPMIREELRRRGLPAELAWLPLLESGFRVDARSPAGAVGLWQLMPETARRFGLRVDRLRDERLDPLRNTRAAADYLAFLAGRFQSWPIVLAAYNAGEGRIGGLLRASGAEDFWALAETGDLPEETRDFVPAVIALSIIGEERRSTSPR